MLFGYRLFGYSSYPRRLARSVYWLRASLRIRPNGLAESRRQLDAETVYAPDKFGSRSSRFH